MLAVKGLPPQQQLLLCAAANLIGDASAQTPLKGTPSRRLSGLGCATPMSAGNKVQPSDYPCFGCLPRWSLCPCKVLFPHLNVHSWGIKDIVVKHKGHGYVCAKEPQDAFLKAVTPFNGPPEE